MKFCTAVELRESAEPVGTDHTGDIVSFTALGSGDTGTSPHPWICYTAPNNINPINVEWQTPDGVHIMRDLVAAMAPNNTVITRSYAGEGGNNPGVILYRGTNYFSPDGDYCCVLTMDDTESERRCVTFSEY